MEIRLKGVFIPGEIESKIEEERRKKGIPISEGVWQDLKRMSETYKESLEI
ncbi:hypothetical protein ES702_04752 [subsurface metagenome]